LNKDYIKISVSINDLGKRIDKVLSEKIEGFSRNKIQDLITGGNITLDNLIIKNQSLIIKKEGTLLVNLPKLKKSKLIAKKIDLNIFYEDEYLLVLNKRAGLIVHPGAGNYDNTLVNGLLYHCKKSLSGIGGVLRPGIVHRIDKMTSGLLVIAKNDTTHNNLSEQFKNRKIDRKYICLTWNSTNLKKGFIKKNVIRSRVNRKKMVVCDEKVGKDALTEYQIKRKFDFEKLSICLYECKLHTGRTHQIRVHLNHIGIPLIGDFVYKKNINKNFLPTKIKENIEKNFIIPKRQALHAQSIGFFHPYKKKTMYFESEEPKEFRNIMLLLEEYS
jgi:23S rRNA pseudouridine1911/1915/1917 synthase